MTMKRGLIAKFMLGENAEVYHAKIIIGKTEPREGHKEVPFGVIAGMIVHEDGKEICPGNDRFELWECDLVVIPKIKHKGGGEHQGTSIGSLLEYGLDPELWEEHEEC